MYSLMLLQFLSLVWFLHPIFMLPAELLPKALFAFDELLLRIVSLVRQPPNLVLPLLLLLQDPPRTLGCLKSCCVD